MYSLLKHYRFLKFSLIQSQNPIFYSYLLRNLHHFSTSSSSNVVVVNDNEKKKNPSPKIGIGSTNIAELLKSSCGFSPEEAKALESRLLASAVMRKKQPKIIQNARDVIEFFREAGFYDTHIRKIVSIMPIVLNSSVEETLKPKIRAFEDLGLCATEIRDFFLTNISALHHNPAHLIAVFSNLFEKREDVVRVIKKCRYPPTLSIGSNLEPQISKYLEHGIPKEKLARFVANYPDMILIRPQVIEARIQKAYEMGLEYGDAMLLFAVRVIGSMKKSTWNSKLKVLRSYGWEESDIFLAFRKSPFLLAISVGKMRKTLEFFMKDLEYEPTELARHSTLLSLSLDKRIVPRYKVLLELDSMGLLKKKQSFSTVLRSSEKQFQKDFLLKVKDKHPNLFQSYVKRL